MAELLTAETSVRQNPRIVSRPTQEGAVLLHLDTGSYHSVNSTGLLIWEALAEGGTATRVRDALASHLDVDPAVLLEDVMSFLTDLAARDAVVVG